MLKGRHTCQQPDCTQLLLNREMALSRILVESQNDETRRREKRHQITSCSYRWQQKGG